VEGLEIQEVGGEGKGVPMSPSRSRGGTTTVMPAYSTGRGDGPCEVSKMIEIRASGVSQLLSVLALRNDRLGGVKMPYQSHRPG
jgi:hypothetical protein